MSSFEEFYNDVDIMMSTLWVPYKRASIGREFNDVFLVDSLGVIVCAINASDYSYVLNKLSSIYGKHRYVFLTPDNLMYEAKYDVIWELMRSGFMRYLRSKYQRQFNSLMDGGFARRIIKERLKIWAGQDKYKFLIEDNEAALSVSVTYILTKDPAFFDYMPEKT